MIEFSNRRTYATFPPNIYNFPPRQCMHFVTLFVLFSPTTIATLQTMHPPPTGGQTTVPLSPFPSEVKSRGVHFPDSAQLTESPESFENPLPPETSSKVLGLSALANSLAHPPLDRVSVIDPRLQMIKRRSQCEARLSPLCSLRQTMRVPFPESSPYAPANFTPNWTPFPVRDIPLVPRIVY